MASIEEQAAKKQVLSEQLNSFEINKIKKINEIRDYMMKKWFLPISDVAYQAYDDAKRAQDDAQQMTTELQNLKTQIATFENEIKAEKCKSCNQTINKTQVDKIKKKLSLSQKTLQDLTEQYVKPTEIFPSVQVVSLLRCKY